MSYAEYGPRIFMPVNLKTEKFLIKDDEIAQVRSGHRLKVYDSCLDIRTWSPKQLDTFQYFRDVTENENIGKIVPIDYLVDIINALSAHSELELLRDELRKYKSLKLTAAQTAFLKQDGDFDFDYKSLKNNENLTVTENSIAGDEDQDDNFTTVVSEASETTIGQESQIYSNFTSTESLSQLNKTYDSDEASQLDSNSQTIDDATFSNRSCDSKQLDAIDSEKTRIIKNESMIIALKNDIGVKKAELDELKDVIKDLRRSLEDHAEENRDLHNQLMTTQRQLKQAIAERNSAIDECKKISNGKTLIDQLKSKLQEKRDQCLELSQEIDKLRSGDSNYDRLRAERNNLSKKLEDLMQLLTSIGIEPTANGIKKLHRERHELIQSEKHLHLQCLEKEDEVAKLGRLIDRMCNDNQKRQNDLKQVIDNLKAELKNKNKQIDEYKDRISSTIKEYEKKIFNEKSNNQKDTDDKTIDKALAFYLKKSLEKIKQFSDEFQHLRSGGGDGSPHKSDFEQMKIELMEPMKELKDQIVKKTNEAKLYLDRYEEAQKMLKSQTNELAQLRQEKIQLEASNLIIDELKKTSSKMELKFIELHKEHSNLTNTIYNLNSEITLKNDQIIDLETEKEALTLKLKTSAIEIKIKDDEINTLKEENTKIEKKLKETEESAEKIRNQMEELKNEGEILNQLSFLQKEIVKYGKDKKKLEETINQLRDEFKACKSSNQTLSENLNNKLRERESLQSKIVAMRENVSQLSNELKFNNFDDKNLSALPLRLSESIEILKKRLNIQEKKQKTERPENDVEEYQREMMSSPQPIRKSEMFFKKNLHFVDGSKDGIHRVQFESKNVEDCPKVAIFKNPQNFHGNQRYSMDFPKVDYQYVPKSDSLGISKGIDPPTKNFITTCGSHRKPENY